MIGDPLLVASIKDTLTDSVLTMKIIDTMVARVCGTAIAIVLVVMVAACVITWIKSAQVEGIR